MDVAVPLGTEPGTYQSRLVVRAGRYAIGQLAIELIVWPFALSSQPHLPLLVGLDVPALLAGHLVREGRPYVPVRLTDSEPMRQSAIDVIRAGMNLLHDHLCSGYLTGYLPVIRRDDQGRAAVEWSDYDDLVAPYLEGWAFANRVKAAGWPLPVGADFPPPDRYGGAAADGYWRFLGSYLAECSRHFEQQGWLAAAFALYDTPAPNNPADYRRFRRFAEQARRAELEARVAASVLPQSMTAYGWPGCYYEDVSQLVDVWAMPGRFYDPMRMSQLQQTGAEAWLRVDRPPFAGSVDVSTPPAIVRAIPWQAGRCEADAVLVPRGNRWPARTDHDIMNHQVQGGGDWLLWPGPEVGLEVPVGSIRLKQLRRGLQDYEYLWLLRQYGRPELAEMVAESMVKYVGTDAYGDNHLDGVADSVVLDGQLWALARRLMGEELARAVGGSGPTPIDTFARQLGWQRLLTTARCLRLSVDGVRIHAAEREGGNTRIQVLVSVRNELRKEVEGVLRFSSVPVGWQVGAEQTRVGPIGPMTTVRASLVAEAKELGADQYGVVPFIVTLDVGQDGHVSAEGRLAALSVPWLSGGITVDGDPSDWPVGLNNTAGDFVLFDRRPQRQDGPSEIARSSQQTLVFAIRDERQLYVLIHCMDDRMALVRGEQSNEVRYDGLVPVGQDLVEILIDPSNAGTGASGDLYCLLVKPNGVVIGRRGVGVDPPIGTRAEWNAKARAHVTSLRDRWIVEMSIPLLSFEGWAAREPIWGLNVARFEARLGEYSSWSGAQRHMYDTRSLGNLIWGGGGPTSR
jgi:hypothetical protein